MDLDYLKQLAQLMKESDLSELAISEEGVEIKLRRGPKGAPRFVSPYPVDPGMGAVSGGGGTQPPAEPEGTVTIKSPMVGTFYSSPAPGSDTFVSVGDLVEDDTTVCIVEAMKVMNEIKAELRGEIIEMLARDAEPVQFGTPLFRVRPH